MMLSPQFQFFSISFTLNVPMVDDLKKRRRLVYWKHFQYFIDKSRDRNAGAGKTPY